MSVPASLQVLLGGSLLRPMLLVLPGETAGRMVMSPAVGVGVTVKDSLGDPVDVFATDALTGTPLTQPLASDVQGRVAGFVAQPERLFVTMAGTGITPQTVEVGLDRDPVSITDVHVVGSDAAMLAIAGAHEGTVAVRTDLADQAFMHNGGTSGTDADWTEIGFGNAYDAAGAALANRNQAIALGLAIGG